MNLIVQDLAVGYRGREIASGISLQAAAGDCLLICGLNGSGKTTLLRTLAGLLPPVAGSFLANGRVVMVPTRIPRVKGFTVSEFLRLATGAAPADAARAIEQAGLPTLADRDISTLSDGQFQRACIATALCRRAAVILLDEHPPGRAHRLLGLPGQRADSQPFTHPGPRHRRRHSLHVPRPGCRPQNRHVGIPAFLTSGFPLYTAISLRHVYYITLSCFRTGA